MVERKRNIKNGRGGDRERRRLFAQCLFRLPLSQSPLLPLSLIALLAAAAPAFAQQLPQNVDVWPMGSASQNIMMAALAGIVNRNPNGELLLSPNDATPPNPIFWLNQLKVAYPQVQSTVQSS